MDILLGAAAGVQNVQNCKSETVKCFHFALHTGCWTIFFYCLCISGCRTPENLCQAVIDLRLQEQLEENKIITEQMKKLIIEEEVMKKQIYDLQIHSETREHETDTLKATNLELQGKVCYFITTFLVLLWACYKLVNIYFYTKKGRQSIDHVIFNSGFALW